MCLKFIFFSLFDAKGTLIIDIRPFFHLFFFIQFIAFVPLKSNFFLGALKTNLTIEMS